jgi:hypothetical protein
MVRSFRILALSSAILAACGQPTPAAKADAKQADAKQADAKQADAKQADAKQPDAKQADAKQADAKQADAKQADAKQPDAVEPPDADAKQPEPAAVVSTGTCSDQQATISKEADERAKPYGIVEHLTKNFPDLKVSWLMKEGPYQSFVVEPAAERFGRCDDTGCYLFAAPTRVIEEAVQKSMKDGTHDPALLGQALGLPAKNFEGPLRMMTLDLDDDAPTACVRLPVDTDPGVWKCQSPEDTDCFKFGGYTSGSIPEVMVIDAPVAKAVVKEIQ